MASYLITYRKHRGRKEKLVELTNEARLLDWIAKNADKCDSVLIQRVKE